MASASWDAHGHQMAPTSEDDFHQFLDMSGLDNLGDDIQFDFTTLQNGASQNMTNQPREQIDTIMSEPATSAIMPHSGSGGMLPDQSLQATSASSHTSMPAQMMPPTAPSTDPISNIDAQIEYLQQQKFQQQQRQLQEQRSAFFYDHSGSVPPTPQSLEMAPGSGQLYSQAEQMSQSGVYDGGYQQRVNDQQDMTFTPLVSPAVTPLDIHFQMDGGFAVPGVYFSPLSSPALHAQTDSMPGYERSMYSSHNSPIDRNPEATSVPSKARGALAKKARKSNAAKPREKATMRSSPISKAQRRKTGPSPAIVSQVLTEVEEVDGQAHDSLLLPMPATSSDGSEENASVSPETLTEMPPPPLPVRKSTSKSPFIQPQSGSHASTLPTPTQGPSAPSMPAVSLTQRSGAAEELPHPATPASLMKLSPSRRKRTPTGQLEPNVVDNIETLELPDPVSKRQAAPINTQTASISPNLMISPGEPQNLQPLPSPVSKPPAAAKTPGTASATQSPQLRPGSSGPAARRTPQLAARSSRKRSSGSVHVSPALLPRISPNIKPLLPGTSGMSAEDTASRLLMSKSNYQNILEGNEVPGVSYPSELSTNLTSKRTSHKIAEQGRRNRINTALQEMAGLLPEQQKDGSDDESDKKDGKQPNSANSKASVVENAIVHMKSLKQENVDLKNELQEMKVELERLRASA